MWTEQQLVNEWQCEVFGEPGGDPSALITKLKEESLEELIPAIEQHVYIEAPDGGPDFKAMSANSRQVAEEIADVVFLLFRAAHRSGIDVQQEVLRKLETNREREWQDDGNGVFSHVD